MYCTFKFFCSAHQRNSICTSKISFVLQKWQLFILSQVLAHLMNYEHTFWVVCCCHETGLKPILFLGNNDLIKQFFFKNSFLNYRDMNEPIPTTMTEACDPSRVPRKERKQLLYVVIPTKAQTNSIQFRI